MSTGAWGQVAHKTDMAQNIIHTRTSRTEIKRVLSSFPAIARAGGPIVSSMLTRCGMALLGRIRQAFVVKARGGVDEAGEKWKPLSPKTIAYSKTRRRSRTGSEKGRPTHPSQALSSRQSQRWWEVYRRQLAMRRGDKSHAAAVAWLILKEEGARTLLEKYGTNQVEILRDTGLLLNSLSPGVGSPNSVFRVNQNSVVVGTNRKGAAAHHRGIPGRLPQRRLWPAPQNWPASWWRDIMSELKQGILDLVVGILFK